MINKLPNEDSNLGTSGSSQDAMPEMKNPLFHRQAVKQGVCSIDKAPRLGDQANQETTYKTALDEAFHDISTKAAFLDRLQRLLDLVKSPQSNAENDERLACLPSRLS